MDNNQKIINENINLEEIISIINLMGLTRNRKHIDLRDINFKDKTYSIKKEAKDDIYKHEEIVNIIITCSDERKLDIRFYYDCHTIKSEWDDNLDYIKISYSLPNGDMLVLYNEINQMYKFLDYESETIDIIHDALKNISIKDLVNNDSSLTYTAKDDMRPVELHWNLIPKKLKEQIQQKRENLNKKYNLVKSIDIDKEKISSLIKDESYSFNQITIELLNDIKNRLLNEKKSEIEWEIENQKDEIKDANKLMIINNNLKNMLNNTIFSKEELLMLHNHLMKSIKQNENNKPMVLIKTR